MGSWYYMNLGKQSPKSDYGYPSGSALMLFQGLVEYRCNLNKAFEKVTSGRMGVKSRISQELYFQWLFAHLPQYIELDSKKGLVKE